MVIKLTKPEAREFLVRAHLLDGPRLPKGRVSLKKVLDRFHTVQVDSVDVCGTNQEIAFASRIEGFLPEHLDDALYGKNPIGFEYWSKAMCILPKDAKPYYEPMMKKYAERESVFLEEYKDVVKYILGTLKKNGPTHVADFEDRGRIMGDWIGEVKLVKRTLDHLWGAGEVMICGRKARQRCFDLPDRRIPWSKKMKSQEEYMERVVWDRICAMRLTRKKGAVGETWYGISEFRDKHTDKLEEDGKALAVEVEGIKYKFLIPQEDKKLIGKGEIKDKAVRLIAPLDSLIWDRRVVQELFDFNAVFEIYLPPQKRRWGYYCLPVLYGADLVGRVELARDKKAGVLVAKGIFWEDGFRPDDEFRGKFVDALEDHARFCGMDGAKYNL